MAKHDSPYYFWADVIRISAILLVVLLHTFVLPAAPAGSNFFSVFLFVFAKTSVPLFVMLSGALLLPKRETWQEFFRKRVKRILMPWLTWTLVFFVLMGGVNFGSPIQSLLALKGAFSAYFTFLPLIVCLYLLVPQFRIMVTKDGKALAGYSIVLWFLAVSVLPFVRNTMAFPLSVDNGLVTRTVQFSGYLLSGWLLANLAANRKQQLALAAALLLGSLGWAAWLVNRSTGYEFVFIEYRSPWIVVASMAVFWLAVNSEKVWRSMFANNQDALQALSRASFGVFLIHDFIKQALMQFSVISADAGLANSLARWVIVSTLSFAIILLLTRIKWLRRWVS